MSASILGANAILSDSKPMSDLTASKHNTYHKSRAQLNKHNKQENIISKVLSQA